MSKYGVGYMKQVKQFFALTHVIELEIGNQPIKIHPYRHPERIRDEIEEKITLGIRSPNT